jgi:hypothetical protein
VREAIPKPKLEVSETQVAIDRKLDYDEEDSDTWQPSRPVQIAPDSVGTRRTRRSGAGHLVEGLRKRKRRRQETPPTEVDDTPEDEKRSLVGQAFGGFKSVDSSIVIDLTAATLSSSQRRQYETISVAPSSEEKTVTSSLQSLAMAPESQRSMDGRGQRRSTRRTARIQEKPDLDFTGQDDTKDKHDQDGVGFSHADAEPEPETSTSHEDHAQIITTDDHGKSEHDAEPTTPSKGSKGPKRKRDTVHRGATVDQESDFEPSKPLKKQKSKPTTKAGKGRKKAKKAKEVEVHKNSVPTVQHEEDLLDQETEGPASGGEMEVQAVELGQTSKAALQERDANSAIGGSHDETGPPEQLVDQSEPSMLKAEPTTVPASTKNAVIPSLSAQGKGPKKPYRVGLSRTARIPSLLRITRK